MSRQLNRFRRPLLYSLLGAFVLLVGSAIDHPRGRCLQFAKEAGFTRIREYVDWGQPSRLERQIELPRVLDDLAKRHDASYLITWDQARLAPSLRLHYLIERIHACGAEVMTAAGTNAYTRGDALWPMRDTSRLSDIGQEALANPFADRVLHGDRHPAATSQREGRL